MCHAFAEGGHRVLLLTPNRPEIEPDVNDLHAFYGVAPNFEVRRLAWRSGRTGAYGYAALAAVEARRFASEVVYGRYLAGVYAATLVGLPSVYEAHLLPISGRIESRLHRALLRSKRLKRVVVVSQALKTDYQKAYGVRDEVLLVAHDGADDIRQAPEERIFESTRFQVGYVGNLYPGKGVEIIVALASCCLWAEFHIVGGEERDVNRWRTEAAEARNVVFHGFVPHSETERFRQRCDVLLAPYQPRVFVHGGKEASRWMSPLKVFEYMAAGKPILASNLPVLREVLTDGVNAQLCDPRDVSSWVTQLARLRSDSTLRRRLGENARREFLMRHTWRVRAESVLAGLALGAH
jgi:glycosyltransferase involved in cell wall biosynthesis